MRLFISLMLLLAVTLAHAQVGRVLTVQGSALVERDGKSPRILAAGEPLEQRDVINTAHASNAVLEFRDRTRITLRPSTRFRVDSYSDAAPQGMVFGLAKGGFRAATGDVAKTNPTAVRFQTDSVVLGIRGTEFDARLCEDDCNAEERARPVLRADSKAAARVIEVSGEVEVSKIGSTTRVLVPGALLFPGETIATAHDAQALVAFRDGSRVSLAASSVLDLAQFDYDEARPASGRARMKLASGKAHVWTGALAKAGPEAFMFETQAGPIRTTGTNGAGFSVSAARGPGSRTQAQPLRYADARGGDSMLDARSGDAATLLAAAEGEAGDDVIVVHTWDGTVIIQTPRETIEIPASSTLSIAVIDGRVTFLPKPPPDMTGGTPRLDRVSVDPATFGAAAPVDEGLYVWVRSGAVALQIAGEVIEVKAGGAARVGNTIEVLKTIPNFMRFDLTPRPGTMDLQNVPRFFRASDGSIRRMCR